MCESGKRNVRKWKKACTKVEKGMYESGMRNVERGMYETTKMEAFFDESTNVDRAEESRAPLRWNGAETAVPAIARREFFRSVLTRNQIF